MKRVSRVFKNMNYIKNTYRVIVQYRDDNDNIKLDVYAEFDNEIDRNVAYDELMHSLVYMTNKEYCVSLYK